MDTERKVGDYVTLQRGITYKGNLVGKPGPALLGLGSIQPGGGFREGDYKTYGGECPPKLMLSPGDLFVSLKGATKDGEMIGSIARVPVSVPSGRLTQDTVKLEFRSPDRETSQFLYWVLRTPQYRDYCRGRARGSAVVALSREDFLGYPVPPITDERLQLTQLFEALDEKIELNRRMNATLEAMARALFQSWFVDFDPVRAKAEGRPPAGLDEPTAALFPAQFQASELGEIPQGWRIGTLGEVATNPRRGVDADEINGATAYIGLEHMPRRSIALSEWDTAEKLESNKSEFKRGEILFGKLRPYFHKVGVAPLDGVCSTDILVITPTNADWFGFVLSHVSSVELVNHTDAMSTGTKMPRTKWKDIAHFQVVLPPKQASAAFTQLVDPLVQHITANIHQSHTLATLRDTLLPKLLSGELLVPLRLM